MTGEVEAARIARRDALEARLREVWDDALHKLRVYVDTLDDERRVKLHVLLDQAEITGNYHTVCYMLPCVETDVRALRDELSELIRQVEGQDDGGDLHLYERQKGRPPKEKGVKR